MACRWLLVVIDLIPDHLIDGCTPKTCPFESTSAYTALLLSVAFLCLCLAGGFMKPGDKDTWGYKMFALISWSCVLEISFRWYDNVFTGADKTMEWPKSLRGTPIASAKATADSTDLTSPLFFAFYMAGVLTADKLSSVIAGSMDTTKWSPKMMVLLHSGAEVQTLMVNAAGIVLSLDLFTFCKESIKTVVRLLNNGEVRSVRGARRMRDYAHAHAHQRAAAASMDRSPRESHAIHTRRTLRDNFSLTHTHFHTHFHIRFLHR